MSRIVFQKVEPIHKLIVIGCVDLQTAKQLSLPANLQKFFTITDLEVDEQLVIKWLNYKPNQLIWP